MERATPLNGHGRRVLMALALAAACYVPPALAAPNPATQKKYESWTVTCQSKDVCIAHTETAGLQILVGKTSAESPVRIAMRVAKTAKRGDPAAIRLSDGWQAGARVGVCNENICEIAIAPDATDKTLTEFLKSQDGVVAYQIKGKILIASVSFAGFRKALDDVQRK